MKRIVNLGVFFILMVSFVMPVAVASAASGPQTYTILVGAENVSRGISLMSYFPATLKIHVGDTVLWKANSHEIHTVTFLAGEEMPEVLVPAPANFPPGAMMLNPVAAFPAGPTNGMYDGTTYANSGLLSTDPGQLTQYSLTFSTQGTFTFVCIVHGVMMSGKIQVVAASDRVPSPESVMKQARRSIKIQLGKANSLFGPAMSQVPRPVHNPDGTTSYTVVLGFSKGNVMLMDFFPRKLSVHPGDTVNFILGKNNDAPHTVTFLNGAPDISFVNPTPNPNPPPPVFLLINPEVVMPINPGQPLTRNGIFSSGLLNPGGPGPTSYQITIGNISGDISYECLLHDSSGMQGLLRVVTK
jgi:plastocyanin